MQSSRLLGVLENLNRIALKGSHLKAGNSWKFPCFHVEIHGVAEFPLSVSWVFWEDMVLSQVTSHHVKRV